MRPLLARLVATEAVDECRDVVMMIDGSDTGARFVIDVETIGLLARARCGLMFDVYNESESDDD